MATRQIYTVNHNGIWERKKQWRARVKVDWTEHYLGVFATKGEAERVEREFKNER